VNRANRRLRGKSIPRKRKALYQGSLSGAEKKGQHRHRNVEKPKGRGEKGGRGRKKKAFRRLQKLYDHPEIRGPLIKGVRRRKIKEEA